MQSQHKMSVNSQSFSLHTADTSYVNLSWWGTSPWNGQQYQHSYQPQNYNNLLNATLYQPQFNNSENSFPMGYSHAQLQPKHAIILELNPNSCQISSINGVPEASEVRVLNEKLENLAKQDEPIYFRLQDGRPVERKIVEKKDYTWVKPPALLELGYFPLHRTTYIAIVQYQSLAVRYTYHCT